MVDQLNLDKTKGWYSLENDGIQTYNWSSDVSVLETHNSEINEYKSFVIKAASKVKKTLTVLYDNEEKYDIDIFNTWKLYTVPYNGSKTIKLITNTHVANPPIDTRKIGIQVSNTYLDKTSPPNILIYNDRILIKPIKSNYIDIIYVLHNKEKSRLKIRTKTQEKTYKIISGGERLICFRLLDDDINSDGSVELFLSKEINDVVDINYVINRESYCDFIGIKQSNIYNTDSKNNEETCKTKSLSIPLRIQWFVTFKCTFKCSYCWQNVLDNVYRTYQHNVLYSDNWVEAFHYYNPSSIDITGGEPTTYQYLVDVINKLDPKIILTMSSNLGPSFNINHWKEIKPGRISKLSFSFHPTQWENPMDFFEKLNNFIKYYGNIGVEVEMVDHSENIEKIKPFDVKKWCDDNGIMCKFDYCTSTNKVNVEYIPDKIIEYNECNMSKCLSEYKLSIKQDNSSYYVVYCPAGWKKVNIDPNGNIFTCLSSMDRGKYYGLHSLGHYNIIGNVFNKDSLRNNPIICWEKFRCSTCDINYLGNSWTEVNTSLNNYKLPIPE